jgi:hypothetical protein
MPGVYGKAELPLGLSGKSAEENLRSLEHLSAALAHQMRVREGGYLVRRWPMPEVRVDEHSKGFQVLEIPVDGRHVDIGKATLHCRSKLLGAHMIICLEQHLEDGPPRCAHSSPPRTHEGENLLDRYGQMPQRLSTPERCTVAGCSCLPSSLSA